MEIFNENNFWPYLLALMIFSLTLASIYNYFKNNTQSPKVNLISNKSSGFWNFEQNYLACYLAINFNEEDLSEELFDNVVEVIGRSKSAVERKMHRFRNADSPNSGLSKLDINAYKDIKMNRGYPSFYMFVSYYESLGGDSRELEKLL